MGVGVRRLGKQPAHRARFHHLPRIHHRHPLRDFGHHRQVMGDHDQGHALRLLQADQQVHDLGLNGHVQRRGGFIGNQQLGVAGNGNGNHHALAHAPRKLVRVVVQPAFGPRYLHHLQQLNGPGARCRTAQTQVLLQHLDQLKTNGKTRVQRGHRVLENHGHVFAQNLSPLTVRNAQQVPTLKLQQVCADTALPLQQTHQRHHGHRLARARLAHNAQNLARLDRQVNAIHRLEGFALRPEFDA